MSKLTTCEPLENFRTRHFLQFSYPWVLVLSVIIGVFAALFYLFNWYNSIIAVILMITFVVIIALYFLYLLLSKKHRDVLPTVAATDGAFSTVNNLFPLIALMGIFVISNITAIGRIYNGLQSALLGVIFALAFYTAFSPEKPETLSPVYGWLIPGIYTIAVIVLIILLSVSAPSNLTALIIITFVIYFAAFLYYKSPHFCGDTHSFAEDLTIIKCAAPPIVEYSVSSRKKVGF